MTKIKQSFDIVWIANIITEGGVRKLQFILLDVKHGR